MNTVLDFQIKKAGYEDLIHVKELEQILGLSEWAIKDYKFEIEFYKSLFYVLRIKGKVEGFIIARLIMNSNSHTIENVTSQYEIYNLAVSTNYQKQGFGSRLLQIFFEIIRENSSIEVFLEVRESNFQAINFYQRNGFIITGSRKNFYAVPNDNAILMTKYLLKN